MKSKFIAQHTLHYISEKLNLPENIHIHFSISTVGHVYWTAYIHNDKALKEKLWWGRNNKFILVNDDDYKHIMFCNELKDLIVSINTHYQKAQKDVIIPPLLN